MGRLIKSGIPQRFFKDKSTRSNNLMITFLAIGTKKMCDPAQEPHIIFCYPLRITLPDNSFFRIYGAKFYKFIKLYKKR